MGCIDIFNKALERGISLLPGILFSATRRYKNFIRISCGQPWSEALEQSVIELAGMIAPQQCRGQGGTGLGVQSDCDSARAASPCSA